MFPFRIIKCLRKSENLFWSAIHLRTAEPIQGIHFRLIVARDCIRIHSLALIRPAWGEREDIYAKKILLQLGAVYKRWSNYPESEVVAPECRIFPKSSPLEGKFAIADVHKCMQCYSSGLFLFRAMSSIQRTCELLQE